MGADGEGSGQAAPERLQGVPWFAACTEEQLSRWPRIAERLRIQAGEVILREGRLGRELFVILEGTATVTREGDVVNIFAPGDYFGELAAIEAVPRSATVHATTDLEVLIVGPREFETMMEIPGFRNTLLTGMSRRIREADDRLAAYEELEDPAAGVPDGAPATRLIGQAGAAARCASLCSPMARAACSALRSSSATRSLSAAGRRRRTVRASSISAAATKGGEPMRRARRSAASWCTSANARSPKVSAKSPR